jgi:hypothetical protein
MKHITLPVLDEAETREVSREMLEVEDLPGDRVRLLHSPALVWGIARADIIRLDVDKLCGYTVVERGGNVAVVVAVAGSEEKDRTRSLLEPRVVALGGVSEGGPDRALVFSIPVSVGFLEIEKVFAECCSGRQATGWWYGNVYGPDRQPLNWWVH